jgi:hypothetical protein
MPPEKVPELANKIKRTTGNLFLTLEWNDVSSASAFGVYEENGNSGTNIIEC